jgi:hypothetical protein
LRGNARSKACVKSDGERRESLFHLKSSQKMMAYGRVHNRHIVLLLQGIFPVAIENLFAGRHSAYS